MSFKYTSGEEILAGDQITYGEAPGVVEFVVDAATGDPVRDWFFTEFGGGVMITAYGGVFLNTTDDEEDLILVARAEGL